MAEKMTLEQVRDALYAIHDDERPAPMRKEARAWASVIDAHLTQPAQAVDVGAIREVIAELARDDMPALLRLRQKLTRALGNAQAEGWRPIGTAPKDGTPIILGYAKSHSCEGFWMGKPERNHWGEMGWFDSDSDVLCEHPHHPDAWMPLPTPPQPEE